MLKDYGFEYKTSIIWLKENSYGLGYWFRGMSEILLVGIKGNVRPFKAQIPNVISCPIQKHSRKPDRFRRIIETVTKNKMPRIELFARMKVHDWDVWGNDPNIEQQNLELFNDSIH